MVCGTRGYYKAQQDPWLDLKQQTYNEYALIAIHSLIHLYILGVISFSLRPVRRSGGHMSSILSMHELGFPRNEYEPPHTRSLPISRLPFSRIRDFKCLTAKSSVPKNAMRNLLEELSFLRNVDDA